jgi:hypothetical protein
MNKYADYDFYVNEYKGTLTEQSFDSYIVKSSKAIERNINRKLNQEIFDNLSDEDIKEKISYVACELCDYYDSYGDITSTGNPSSISIDGVSISNNSYTSSQNENSKKLASIYNDLPQDWIRFL